MRKEYSDLSAEQKIVFIKRNIIIGIFSIVPVLIIVGILFTILSDVKETITQYNDIISANQTTNDDVKKLDAENELKKIKDVLKK